MVLAPSRGHPHTPSSAGGRWFGLLISENIYDFYIAGGNPVKRYFNTWFSLTKRIKWISFHQKIWIQRPRIRYQIPGWIAITGGWTCRYMNLNVQTDTLPKDSFPWEPNPLSVPSAKKKPGKFSPPAHLSWKAAGGTQTDIHPQRPKTPVNQIKP